MYALDTNTVIYFFKGQGKVAERLLAASLPKIHCNERPCEGCHGLTCDEA